MPATDSAKTMIQRVAPDAARALPGTKPLAIAAVWLRIPRAIARKPLSLPKAATAATTAIASSTVTAVSRQGAVRAADSTPNRSIG